jgi:uncharacterized protein with von Willebrand factor type A (vWA) domain
MQIAVESMSTALVRDPERNSERRLIAVVDLSGSMDVGRYIWARSFAVADLTIG